MVEEEGKQTEENLDEEPEQDSPKNIPTRKLCKSLKDFSNISKTKKL